MTVSPDPNTRFVTLATAGRQPWLGVPRTRDAFLAVLRGWHMERSGRILAVQAMPDHVHVLFEPGRPAEAVQVVARWKVALRRGAGYAETFDEEYRDQVLDRADQAEDFARYMMLDPYLSGIATSGQPWPGWWLPDDSRLAVGGALPADGVPPPDWAQWTRDKFAGLAHGE